MARKRGKNGVNAKGRNTNPQDRFARFPHNILLSEAYRSLDLTARALLVEITMLENGRNNGSLWLSIKDATDRLGLADARPAMRGFQALQDRGLIRMTKEAFFSVKAAETSRARCWRLTWLAWDGKPPSKEWQNYVAPPKTKERKATDRGLRAMARYRKSVAENKMPVVDFTSILPSYPEIAR